jgi:DNA-binding MarR family transcriptional regulator
MHQDDRARASAAFCEVVRLLRSRVRPVWSELELTMAQLKALIAITATGGLTGRDLAERLGIGPSAVTPLVDRLVAHGYVRREEDAADRRITWARPTAPARALFDQLSAANREHFEQLLAGLDPAELATVRAALELLARAAERDLAVEPGSLEAISQ